MASRSQQIQVRAAVRNQFQGAFNQIDSQRVQLQRAQEATQIQQRQLQQQQEQIQSRDALRRASGRGGLAQRRQITSRIQEGQEQLNSQLQQIQQGQRRLRNISDSLVAQEQQAFSSALNRFDRSSSLQQDIGSVSAIQSQFQQSIPQDVRSDVVSRARSAGGRPFDITNLVSSQFQGSIPAQQLQSFSLPAITTQVSRQGVISTGPQRGGIDRFISEAGTARARGQDIDLGTTGAVIGLSAIQTARDFPGSFVPQERIAEFESSFESGRTGPPSLQTFFSSPVAIQERRALTELERANRLTALQQLQNIQENPLRFAGQQLFFTAGPIAAGAGIRVLTRPRLVFRQPIPTPTQVSITQLEPITLGTGQQVFRASSRSAALQPARFEQRASIIQQFRGTFPEPTPISGRRVITRGVDVPGLTPLISESGEILSGAVAARRQGSTITPVRSITGRSQQIEDFSQLTPVETRALIGGIGQETGGLIAVPESAGVQFFRRNIQTQQQVRLSGISGGPISIIRPPIGRTTQTLAGVTAIRELPATAGQPRLFQTVSGQADISLSTAARRITRTDGLVRVINPQTGSSVGEVIVGRGLTQRTVRPSTQVIATAQATAEGFQDLTRAASRSARISARVRPPVQRSLPTTLVSPRRGAFTGLGLFERTEEVAAQTIPGVTQQALIIQARRQLSSQIPVVTQSEFQAIKLRSSQLARQISLTRQRNIAQQGFAQPTAQTSSQVQVQIQRSLLRQLQVQKTSQLIARAVALRTQLPRTGVPPVVPRLPLIIPGRRGSVRKVQLTQILAGSRQGFDVVVGKGKRTTTLARNLPPFLALKTGADIISDTIRASFKLKPSGRSPRVRDIRAFNLNNEFRTGKNDILRIVEKRQFRLNSLREKAQIKASRRRKR